MATRSPTRSDRAFVNTRPGQLGLGGNQGRGQVCALEIPTTESAGMPQFAPNAGVAAVAKGFGRQAGSRSLFFLALLHHCSVLDLGADW
jgi:hypothetical protein